MVNKTKLRPGAATPRRADRSRPMLDELDANAGPLELGAAADDGAGAGRAVTPGLKHPQLQTRRSRPFGVAVSARRPRVFQGFARRPGTAGRTRLMPAHPDHPRMGNQTIRAGRRCET